VCSSVHPSLHNHNNSLGVRTDLVGHITSHDDLLLPITSPIVLLLLLLLLLLLFVVIIISVAMAEKEEQEVVHSAIVRFGDCGDD
jgi:hypothetical protein